MIKRPITYSRMFSADFSPCVYVVVAALCFRAHQARSAPAVTESGGSDCHNTDCDINQYCDTIEKRCSRCSSGICLLGIALKECRQFCADNSDSRTPTSPGPYSMSVLDDVYQSSLRTFTLMLVQLSVLLLMCMVLVCVIVVLRRRHASSVKLQQPAHLSLDSIQMVKRNNLDVAKTLPRTVTEKDTLNLYNSSQDLQTSEFTTGVVRPCSCEQVSGGSDTDGEGATPRQVVLVRGSRENHSLLPRPLPQPSPLSQNL